MAREDSRDGYIGIPTKVVPIQGYFSQPGQERLANERIAHRTKLVREKDFQEKLEDYEPTEEHSLSKSVLDCPRDINCPSYPAVSAERKQAFLDLVVNNANLGD